MEDLEEAVVNVNKFLQIEEGKEKDQQNKKEIGKGHKKLAELNQKLGYDL